MRFKKRILLWANEGGDPGQDPNNDPGGDPSQDPGAGGDGGGQDPGAGDGWLPQEYAENPALSKFENAGDLAKSYLEMEAYRGASIRIPGEDASDEAVAEFHEKLMEKVPGLVKVPGEGDEDGLKAIYKGLGAPDSADGYTTPEIDAQGLDLDMSMAENFKGVAVKYGLNQKQFEGIVKEITAVNIAAGVEAQQAADQDMFALKQEWGQAHDQNVKQVISFAEHTKAPADLVEALKAGNFKSSTAKWLYSMMNQFTGGDNKDFNVPFQGKPKMTPAEARAKIDEIYDNKEHAYWNPSKPGHEDAKKRMTQLYEFLEPGDKPAPGGMSVGVGSFVEFDSNRE